MRYTKDKNGVIYGYDDDQDSLYAERIAAGHTAYIVSYDDELNTARNAQTAIVKSSYQTAISVDISFTTAAGVTAEFQTDEASRTALRQAVMVFSNAGSAISSGFYWQAADNSQPVFTADDLSGLLAAISARDWVYFQKMQELKSEIKSATTIDSVKAIVW